MAFHRQVTIGPSGSSVKKGCELLSPPSGVLRYLHLLLVCGHTNPGLPEDKGEDVAAPVQTSGSSVTSPLENGHAQSQMEGSDLDRHAAGLKGRFGEGGAASSLLPLIWVGLIAQNHPAPSLTPLPWWKDQLHPCLSGLLQLEIQMLDLGPRIMELSTLLPLPLILSHFLLNF